MTTQDPTPVQVIVGSRIRLPDGRFGTIKYIGQVPPTPGQWYGVEWDDENGGKHDGSLNGVRYFQCSSPTSGSFIRPSPKIIFGTSFLSALHTKYTQNNEPQEITSLESINQKEKDTKSALDKGQMYWAGNRNILVETYGFEKITKKQSNLDNLVEVSLVNFDICQSDPVPDIEETVPRIQELDLSKNLFSNWSTVGKICCGLNDLRILRLNHNRFCSLPPQIDDDLMISTAFQNLQTLSLNHTKIGFGDVARLSQYLPTLIELHLGFNGYDSIKVEGRLSHLNNLEVLNLEHNLLSSWNDVQCFRSLPRLSTLMLQHNKLASILPSGKSEFPNLKTVNLTGNEIKDWSSIDALNTFNSLRELRVKDNPVYGYSSPEISRIQVITRIENLVILNGSEIGPRERIDAELYYLKLVATDLTFLKNKTESTSSTSSLHLQSLPATSSMSIDTFRSFHPRYQELLNRHGAPVLSTKQVDSTLASKLIELYFVSVDKTAKKKVTPSLTIRQLKTIAAKLLGIKRGTEIKLIGELHSCDPDSSEPHVVQVELDDDLRDVGFYELTNGDKVVVEKA